MKLTVMWVGCAAVLFGICGCQKPSVVLPPEVAGTWKTKEHPWRIAITPDGKISSVIIPMGTVEVKPNQTTKVEMKDGNFSTYVPGAFDLEYTPETRDLYVSIEMKRMHISLPGGWIDGNSLDRFTGPISEDGKTWIADWIELFDYGPRFPQDPNDAYNGPVTFEKIGD